MRPLNPAPNAAWAAVLSFFVPGLGQVYAQRYRAALGFALASIANATAFVAVTGATLLSPAVLAATLGMVLFTIALNGAAALHAWHAVRHGHDWVRPGWRRSTWTWGVVLVAISLGFEILPEDLGWSAFTVPSSSMLPTLQVGDRFIADGSEAARAALQPGDVIVFRLPRDPSVDYVKRLVALPGQTVQMQHGRLMIDGREVPQEDLGAAAPGTYRRRLTLPDGHSYVVLKTEAGSVLDDTPATTLGPDELFVMGDNLDDSLDSRVPSAVGLVPRELVIGRAAVIFWSRDAGRIGQAIR
ncbi:Signal peptidase I [Rhodovastum atsumiense]|nr:signal peptidase I [Rhodovastum atsumiense]CAH2599072.1 Signal peptidase I [Rhodovastum atsumiense]